MYTCTGVLELRMKRLTNMWVSLIFFLLLSNIQFVENSKILVIAAHMGKSHFDVLEPFLEKLADRGHKLLVISHFPQQPPLANYRDVDLRGTLPTNKTVDFIALKDVHGSQVQSISRLSMWGEVTCEKTLEHSYVQILIKSNETFDLFITEQFNTDCFLAFAHKFSIPVIIFSTTTLMPWAPGKVGNPDNPSYIPLLFSPSIDKMDFAERLWNTFWYLFYQLHHPILMDAPAYKIAKKHFGESLPAMSLLARNTSLILVNNHFSLNRPRPLVPGVVEVAGIHIKPAKKLPEVRHISIIPAPNIS
jgi:glucuronosyltransferase